LSGGGADEYVKHTRKQSLSGQKPQLGAAAAAAPGAAGATPWLPALLTAALTFIAFLPALNNGFVNWDDAFNFIHNPFYRGLGWEQLRWMFGPESLRLGGHYMPLTWLTYGLDYSLWGMNPKGYHLSSLLLHCASAAVFFWVSRRLLALSLPELGGGALTLAAAFSALFFSLHPLRVESAVWITERRGLLGGLFYLLSVLSYLKAAAETEKARRWRGGALLFFVLSMLCKVSGATLPLVLLVLDIYPLRRLPGSPARWFSAGYRHIWLEKLPFLLVAAAAAAVAASGLGAMRQPQAVEASQVVRLASAAYSSVFYIWKTLAPVGLQPVYEHPRLFTPGFLPYGAAALFAAGLSLALYLLRRRAPYGLAVWAAYLLTLLPVLGLVSKGPFLPADRYSYLACLGLAVLAGGLLAQLLRRGRLWLLPACCALALLGALSWRQAAVWRNSESLWGQVLAAQPACALAHNNLALELAQQGRLQEAVAGYQRALALIPGYAAAHLNLGLALAIQGRGEEAIKHYLEALRFDPFEYRSHNALGWALAGSGKDEAALESYAAAVQLAPGYWEPYYGAGRSLARLGHLKEAAQALRKTLELNPGYIPARDTLAALERQPGF
jgi:protein O-mannosyl-transferase